MSRGRRASRREGRLIIVSNRLPVAFERAADGGWRAQATAGGLVTALVPLLARGGGVWIGWPGVTVEEEQGERLPPLRLDGGYEVRGVPLSAGERDLYYLGFSNEILWPLFHDLQTRCTFDPSYWRAYRDVNRKFAAAVAEVARAGDLVWIQDYHLIAVANELRRLGVAARLAYFQHIPFPPLDIFAKLPWRQQILEDLLAHDLVGLQVPRDRRNLVASVRGLLPGARLGRRGALRTIQWRGRESLAGAFPISIDAAGIAAEAALPEVAAAAAVLRSQLGSEHVALGVDRLDYTKGVPFKLAAFRQLLRDHPGLRRRITLVQILAPSREDIPAYLQAKHEVERLVGAINGEFGEPGWVPVHYLHRSFDRRELLAYYQAADICLATPLKDGMNLVAKEYCAADVGQRGVLILSEFAGAARQLRRGALLVNPYDIQGMAASLARAVNTEPAERRRRMRLLQTQIRGADVYAWADGFLAAAASARRRRLSAAAGAGR